MQSLKNKGENNGDYYRRINLRIKKEIRYVSNSYSETYQPLKFIATPIKYLIKFLFHVHKSHKGN